MEPDVCAWVEEHADTEYISLSAATNQLLRDLRDGAPKPAKVAVPKPPARVPRGANPRVAAVLRRNAGR